MGLNKKNNESINTPTAVDRLIGQAVGNASNANFTNTVVLSSQGRSQPGNEISGQQGSSFLETS